MMRVWKFPLNADEQELFTGYDNICALLDKLCLEAIDKSCPTMK